MPENPTSLPLSSPADQSTNINKRYAPPNQRNRSLNRRKSGERFDRVNNVYTMDGEKSQSSRNFLNDPRDAGSSNMGNDNFQPALIALEGCSSSEASQLLNDRWAAAIQCYNDPSIDTSEKPIMYFGSSTSVGGHIKLPHQMINPTGTGGPGSQMDFLGDLRRAMRMTSASSEI